ncbi:MULTISPECIES: hypothetical protein [Halomonadaceae]|jgi:hypothetical protein|uniref:hypothetical protein n=1 Tax=Halomonadaceae TaxID=28256 RepID=UPI0012F04190|nr:MULTISPECIES: hypothetical protein [Halomonas]CAD5270301.1 conserved hypothetical protein [Halomonas sp. 156]CAD5280350.1 conserved hypothetical protein [Halomonas sp. 113]CAD5281838.1 conserved hypothetical protein [Halomonas sp. 59]CAD5287886.1 conserved hypothetical protein [Halomonas sp. I3]VXB11659.1 conserved hypothetical protein [Halomonas titanicae]
MGKGNLKLKAARLHRNYIILILIIIIGIMLTIFSYGEIKLYENISFAATLSSLLLSVVAIIYTLQTSGSLASTLKKIQKTSNILKTTSRKIEQSNIKLGKKVDQIPQELASVKEKLDSSHKLLENLPLTTADDSDQNNNSTYEIPERAINTYVEYSSNELLDLLMIYTYIHEDKKTTNLDGLIDSFESQKLFGLAIGTLQSTLSFNLIQHKLKKLDGNISYVQFEIMNNKLRELIKKKYKETYTSDLNHQIIQDDDENHFNLPGNYDDRIKALRKIINYYSI